MTVYVDDMLRAATIGRNRPARWSHMMADSTRELAEFAQRLGLRPEWLQNPGTHREHYDVTMSVRAQAIQFGAQQITYPAGMADLIEARRAVCQCTTLAGCRWGELTRGKTMEGLR